jgi:arginine decarboxylase-like protein
MEDLKNKVQKEIEKIWPEAKKNITKINRNAVKIMQKSEKDLAAISKNIKTGVEKLVYKAKREELYYELGKGIAPLLTSDQLKDKFILKIYTEIQQLSKHLRKK